MQNVLANKKVFMLSIKILTRQDTYTHTPVRTYNINNKHIKKCALDLSVLFHSSGQWFVGKRNIQCERGK